MNLPGFPLSLAVGTGVNTWEAAGSASGIHGMLKHYSVFKKKSFMVELWYNCNYNYNYGINMLNNYGIVYGE